MKDGTSKSPRHTGDTPRPRRSRCEVRTILDRIADKWSLLVICVLADGTDRFSELRREIDGISQRMLTLTCANSTGGLVARTVHPSSRPASTTSSPARLHPARHDPGARRLAGKHGTEIRRHAPCTTHARLPTKRAPSAAH